LDIRDRIALVTGGAHRVGKAIALALARQGAHVAITFHASEDKAQRTLVEIKACGVEGWAAQCDQSDPAQVAAVFEMLRARWNRLDLLVNSAAIMQSKPFLDITPQEWDATLDINLKGTFLFSQHAGRMMIQQGSGVIINIAD